MSSKNDKNNNNKQSNYFRSKSIDLSMSNKSSYNNNLDKNGYNPLMVAVEINEEIVPKTTFDSHLIKDEDTVEIVSFVGGG